jgi:hypothetical protein
LGAAGPKFFLPPVGGWQPTIVAPAYQFGFTGWKEISAVTVDYIVPMLTDNIFKPSPLFKKLIVKAPIRMRG